MARRPSDRETDDDEGGFADEASRFSGRFRRYTSVGSSVGGLAAQLVGARVFGRKLDRSKHSQELTAALGGLKGPLMKAAQILATIPEALPREYAEQLRQLQSNAPPMGWAFVKRRMRTELGPGWQSKFQDFGQTAAAAASLGQVHKATAHDGRALACKLQYPDMASAVAADVRQLKLAFSVYRQYDRAIDTSDIYKELSDRLREELDYIREARHMRLYAQMLSGEDSVFVPEPVEELTTARLLSMTWLEGQPLLDFIAANEQDVELRNAVARNMFRAWYVPFYDCGIIHGDPHLGNYSVKPDGAVNLLDFGCVRVFRPDFVKGVIDLYFALENDDEELAVEAYRSWGFDNLDRELLDTLNLWARFLYRPLLEDKAQGIVSASDPNEGPRTVGQVHKALREKGGVKPPREFVLMDRAAIGLGSVFLHLKAKVNWHRNFHELIEDFDVNALARRQEEALTAVGLGEEIAQLRG
ncbi:MAG: AarF/UbiB family protein [Rhodovibrionaceae bacterium]